MSAERTTQIEHTFSMSTPSKHTWYSILIITSALGIDVFLSTSTYPLLTIIVCGIVIVLAYVSPYIRKSY